MNGIVTGKIESGGKVPTSATGVYNNGSYTISDIDKYLYISSDAHSRWDTYCVIFPKEKYIIVVRTRNDDPQTSIYTQSVITLSNIGSGGEFTVNFNTNTIVTSSYSNLGFQLFS